MARELKLDTISEDEMEKNAHETIKLENETLLYIIFYGAKILGYRGVGITKSNKIMLSNHAVAYTCIKDDGSFYCDESRDFGLKSNLKYIIAIPGFDYDDIWNAAPTRKSPTYIQMRY